MSSTSEDNRAAGSLSLMHAASDGDVQTMKELLASGANPNTTNQSGQSALMVAALMGHAELVALLLEAGADPQANDRLGLTALEWSKRRGFPKVTQLLVNVTLSANRAKPRTTSEPSESKIETELNNAVEAEPHPEQLGPASRATHKNFLAHRTDEEVTESHAPETKQEQPVVVTSSEPPSKDPAAAADAVTATEPIESSELELPITSERQPHPANESVLDLSTPPVAIPDDSQSPETYWAGVELESREGAVEPEEDVAGPEQDVLEAREGVLDSRERVLEPQEEVVEPREDVTEQQERVVEEHVLQERMSQPEEHVLDPEQDVLEAREEVLESREGVPEQDEHVLKSSPEPLLTDEEKTLTRSHPIPAVEPPRDMSADRPAMAVPESKMEPVAPEPPTVRPRSAYSASLLGLSATTTHESETVVNLKRCPKCHRTFQNTQLSYCPRDYGTLISIDDLKPTPTPSQVSTPLVLWVLVAFVLGASGFGAYKLAGYFLRRDEPVPIAVKPAEKPPETKKPNFTVGGALAGLETSVPEPAYPADLQNSGIAGPITVKIRVNKKGRVISAVSSRGDPRLRTAAVKAAKQATFSPEKLEAVNSRTGVVSGTITYGFLSAAAGSPTSPTATTSPATGVPSETTSPTGTESSLPANTDPNAPVVSESLAGAVVKVPSAEYPRRAKAAGTGGTIIVTVRVNRTGKVVSWRTSTGDSQLRSAALNAARKATFSPGKLPGDGDVLGTITYKFTP